MPIFLMTPRKLDAPEWALSTAKQPIQIESFDHYQARSRAARSFTAAECAEAPAGQKNPWMSDKFVSIKLLAKADPGIPLIPLTAPNG